MTTYYYVTTTGKHGLSVNRHFENIQTATDYYDKLKTAKLYKVENGKHKIFWSKEHAQR